jgi:thiosulfate/3-mercaptopyruvate sulfurtransferase
MRAARELWILEFLGHRRVRLLDGGLGAWKAAGGTVSAEPVAPVPAAFVPRIDLAMAIGLDEIAAAAHAPSQGAGLLLIDTRSAKEFDGAGGHDCCPWQGRIADAVHLEWSDLVDPASGGFRAGPDIAARLAAAAGGAIRPERTLVPYCHRGARSALVTYALRLASFTGVRNFIGSWHEWSHRFPEPGR